MGSARRRAPEDTTAETPYTGEDSVPPAGTALRITLKQISGRFDLRDLAAATLLD